MLCPHCGHDNVEGRRFCRNCAKPLAVESATPIIAPPPPVTPTFEAPAFASPPSKPRVNSMAIASLVLSAFAIIPPLGIASIVLGHISRKEIARSQGRQTGAGIAFTALIASYLQFAVLLLIAIGIASIWHRMNRELGHNEFARAALVEQLESARGPSASDVQRQQRHAIDALRLIHAAQIEYLAAHPEQGYSCELSQLGWDTTTPNELTLHMIESHYEMKIYQCRGADNPSYVVVAIPRSDHNPPNSPPYCVDQTGIVKQTEPAMSDLMIQAILREHKPCPESGIPVE